MFTLSRISPNAITSQRGFQSILQKSDLIWFVTVQTRDPSSFNLSGLKRLLKQCVDMLIFKTESKNVFIFPPLCEVKNVKAHIEGVTEGTLLSCCRAMGRHESSSHTFFTRWWTDSNSTSCPRPTPPRVSHPRCQSSCRGRSKFSLYDILSQSSNSALVHISAHTTLALLKSKAKSSTSHPLQFYCSVETVDTEPAEPGVGKQEIGTQFWCSSGQCMRIIKSS